jgi:integrase
MKRIPRIFTSRFAVTIRQYIQLMRHLGRLFGIEEGHLLAFDAFCVRRHHEGPLTQQLALDFAYSVADLGSQQYAKRYAIIRGFAHYLANYEPQTESLDPHAVPVKADRSLAYIYTDQEISALLNAVPRMRWRDPFRIATYQTMVGLIAAAGLRAREALRLDVDDVDWDAGVLRIRCSKFRKSRLVPIHTSTVEQLRLYLGMRMARGVPAEERAFFVTFRHKRVSYSLLNGLFQRLRQRAGLRPSVGRKPRIHDLRHTFAVRRVLAWYEEGVDVQAKLPLLATYLGHAHFEDTAYYLTAGTELLAKAAERFAQNRSHTHD